MKFCFDLLNITEFRNELLTGNGFPVAIEVSLAHQTKFVYLQIKKNISFNVKTILTKKKSFFSNWNVQNKMDFLIICALLIQQLVSLFTVDEKNYTLKSIVLLYEL